MRDADHDHRHGDHGNRDPARPAHAGLVIAADRIADAHGGGGAEAQGQHVEERGHVDGELIGGERRLAQPAGDDGGAGKGGGLAGNRKAHRQSQQQHLADQMVVARQRRMDAEALAIGHAQHIARQAANISQRVMEVASAAPMAPMAGRPKWPKTRAQASGRFTRLALRETIMPVRGREMPSRKWMSRHRAWRPACRWPTSASPRRRPR